MIERPRFFKDFFGTALTLYAHTNHEEMLEAALGIGRLIDNGEIEAARKLIDQAKEALILERSSDIPTTGETLSHQLKPMIQSQLYPKDLTKIAQQVIEQKYSRTLSVVV